MSSTVKFPGPLERRRPSAASVMAWRVAALFSSRREGAAGTASCGVSGEESGSGTGLHYVQLCTLCNQFPGCSDLDSQENERFPTAFPEPGGRCWKCPAARRITSSRQATANEETEK